MSSPIPALIAYLTAPLTGVFPASSVTAAQLILHVSLPPTLSGQCTLALTLATEGPALAAACVGAGIPWAQWFRLLVGAEGGKLLLLLGPGYLKARAGDAPVKTVWTLFPTVGRVVDELAPKAVQGSLAKLLIPRVAAPKAKRTVTRLPSPLQTSPVLVPSPVAASFPENNSDDSDSDSESDAGSECSEFSVSSASSATSVSSAGSPSKEVMPLVWRCRSSRPSSPTQTLSRIIRAPLGPGSRPAFSRSALPKAAPVVKAKVVTPKAFAPKVAAPRPFVPKAVAPAPKASARTPAPKAAPRSAATYLYTGGVTRVVTGGVRLGA